MKVVNCELLPLCEDDFISCDVSQQFVSVLTNLDVLMWLLLFAPCGGFTVEARHASLISCQI